MTGEVRQTPKVQRVSVLLEAQMTADLAGRRVRLVDASDQWVPESFHLYYPTVQSRADGTQYVDVMTAEVYWRWRHTRQLDMSRLIRWPAGAVFMD